MKITQAISTTITILSLSTTHGSMVPTTQQSKHLKTVWVKPFVGSYKKVQTPFYVTDSIVFNSEADLVGGSHESTCTSLTFEKHTIQLNENQRPNLDDHHWGHTPEIKLFQATSKSAYMSIVNSNKSRELLFLTPGGCNTLSNNFVATYSTSNNTYYVEKNGKITDNDRKRICSIPNDLNNTKDNVLITGFQCTDEQNNTFFITTDNTIYISTKAHNNIPINITNNITLPQEITQLYNTQISPNQNLICIQSYNKNSYTSYLGELNVEKKKITTIQKIKTTKKPQALFFDENNNLHTIIKDSLQLPLLGWLPTTFCIRYFNTQISNGETLLRPQFFTIQKLFTSINLAAISYIAYKTAIYFGADMLQNQ